MLLIRGSLICLLMRSDLTTLIPKKLFDCSIGLRHIGHLCRLHAIHHHRIKHFRTSRLAEACAVPRAPQQHRQQPVMALLRGAVARANERPRVLGWGCRRTAATRRARPRWQRSLRVGDDNSQTTGAHLSGKLSGLMFQTVLSGWSGWQDLNLRPPRPERGAEAGHGA